MSKLGLLLKSLSEPTDAETTVDDKLASQLFSVASDLSWPKPEHIKNSPEQAAKYQEQFRNMAFKANRNFFKLQNMFSIEPEDIRQMIEMGLWAAALTYDSHREPQTKFSTWLYLVSRHFVSREVTRNYIRAGRINEFLVLKTEDAEVRLTDIIEYTELSLFDKIVAHEALELNYTKNKPRDADILVERLIWGLTLEECGVKHRITRERVRQLQERSLQKLKACYKSGKAKLIS